MKDWIENWIFNVYGGKVLARGATLAAAWVFAHGLPLVAAKTGVAIPFTQDQITTAFLGASMWLFEEIKRRRMANPASAAVQTDASKPMGDVSAVAVAAQK